jgi:hypothetical protein
VDETVAADLVDKLALLLAEHGVEVKRATAAFKAGGKEVPAGSYTVPLAQPAKRRIRTLLDPSVPMTDEFLKEQERRRKMKLPDEIYEAAILDSSSSWDLFRHITLPLLSPMLFTVTILRVVEAFKVLDIPFSMTSGGPGASTQTYSFLHLPDHHQ